MWLVVLVVFLTVALFHQLWKACDYWIERGVPHQKGIPILGNFLPVVLRQKSLLDVARDIYYAAPQSRYIGFYQFLRPVLMVRDPDLVKQILIKDFDVFAERNAFVPEDVDPLWANGLFATTAPKWRELRPKLSPAFTTNKMRIMFGLMDECAQQFVNYFRNQNFNGVEVELKDVLTRYTNDVIATTAFGIECDSMKAKNNIFYEMGRDLTNFSGIRSLKFLINDISPFIMKILKIRILPKKPAEYFQSIIKHAIREREKHNIIRPDMIHLLLEARKNDLGNVDNEEDVGTHKFDITDFEIASQAMLFFLAGFETVSSTMCFTLYELAVNTAIQEKLLAEVDALYEETEGKLNYEAISKLKYMDMVVSESLRKWGQAVIIDRKALKPYTIPPKYPEEKPLHVDAGSAVMLPMFLIQRDEKYFPNPEKFDPDRFSDENKSKIVSGTYFPFGMGPRICIGSRFAQLEIKTLLFYFLRSFEVEPCGKTPVPLVLDKTAINLLPIGGFWVQLKRRNKLLSL